MGSRRWDDVASTSALGHCDCVMLWKSSVASFDCVAVRTSDNPTVEKFETVDADAITDKIEHNLISLKQQCLQNKYLKCYTCYDIQVVSQKGN